MAMKKRTGNMPQSPPAETSEQGTPSAKDSSKAGLSAEALAKVGYKKTPLGWLPREWEVANIDKSCRILSGGTPKKDEERFWGGDIPWYSAKDLKSFFLKTSIDQVTQEGVQNGTRLIPKGTILILVRGMMLNRDLPLGIVITDSTFNQDLKALIPKKNVDVRYLAYSLVSRKRRLLGLVNRSSHGTGKIETSTLRSFKIALPPLPEQQQIAAILSAWDKVIERTQALIAAKEERRKGVMQRLLRGKVRLDEFIQSKGTFKTKFGDYPTDWKYPKLSPEDNLHTLLTILKKGRLAIRAYMTKRLLVRCTLLLRRIRQ
ncbi:MAG: restriction endonuclease subunit S [Lewinellaceae bacterium]|nr:restriction endonuclease subunit S [Lewinellaceae bacterium]